MRLILHPTTVCDQPNPKQALENSAINCNSSSTKKLLLQLIALTRNPFALQSPSAGFNCSMPLFKSFTILFRKTLPFSNRLFEQFLQQKSFSQTKSGRHHWDTFLPTAQEQRHEQRQAAQMAYQRTNFP